MKHSILSVVVGAVLTLGFAASATAQVVGAGPGPGPSTTSSAYLPFIGIPNVAPLWNVGLPTSPIDVAFDASAGPWVLELHGPTSVPAGDPWADDDSADFSLTTTTGIALQVRIAGTVDWIGFEVTIPEDAYEDGWRWILNSSVQRVQVRAPNLSVTNAPGLQTVIAPDQGSISFAFDPLAPGTVLQVIVQPFFAGPDGATNSVPTDTFADVLVVEQVPIGGQAEDSDEDGVADDNDNCPDVANHASTCALDDDCLGPDNACDADGVCAAQNDNDGDGAGDECDDDDDDDGVADLDDNCVLDANPDQSDADYDGLGDACDADGFTTDTAAQAVDDYCSLMVDALVVSGVPGRNGMLNKLTGKAGVCTVVSEAVADYDGAAMDTANFVAALEFALGRLDAFDDQVAEKTDNGHLTEPFAGDILDGSNAIRTIVEAMIAANTP